MPNQELSLSTSTETTQDGIGTSPRQKPGIGTTPGGAQDGIGTSPRQKPGIGTSPGGTQDGIGTSPGHPPEPGKDAAPDNNGQAISDAMHDLKAAKAFACEINGVPVPIVSYSGGDLTGEKAEASSGSSQHNESTMGHNYITELTLVTFVTPDDNTFADAAKAIAVDGKNERFTIVITEMAKAKSTVKTFVFDNCLLTSMNFPSVSSHGIELLKRTSTWKPEILTVS